MVIVVIRVSNKTNYRCSVFMTHAVSCLVGRTNTFNQTSLPFNQILLWLPFICAPTLNKFVSTSLHMCGSFLVYIYISSNCGKNMKDNYKNIYFRF